MECIFRPRTERESQTNPRRKLLALCRVEPTIMNMRRIACILLCLLGSSILAAPSEMNDLLQQLNNPDPAIRENIARQIESLGQTARPALIKASQSHDRRIAGRAAEMLMKLPFFREDDPPIFKAVLADYHTKSAEERERIITGDLGRVNDSGKIIARLLLEDPDEQVAWAIADYYVGQIDNFWQPLLAADLSSARPAALETAARALFFTDRAKALQLLKRAIAGEEQYPAAPIEHAREMYLLVAADALVSGDTKAAQEWQRKLASIPVPASPMVTDEDVSLDPSPLFSLLCFYAGTGPIAGFGDDLVQYQNDLTEPENLFGLSQVFDFPGFSSVSATFRHLGMLSLSDDMDERIRIGALVSQRQWVAPTRDVLEDVVKYYATQPKDENGLSQEWRARRMLYSLSREIGDDAEAIRHTQEEIKLYEKNNVGEAVTQLVARLEGHRLHHARLINDKKQMEKSIAYLSNVPELELLDADIGLDWINGLNELGESAKAKSVFNSMFQRHNEMVTATEASAASLNNITWLCAGVRMRTDFALDAAMRAIRAEPSNYGYIDTAAEANYALGKIDRAIELETFALALRPGDRFLLSQLAKFKSRKQ